MQGWWQDVVYAGRMILKRPGTSVLAVVALALGIGLTTMMFSIVQGVILRGLPFDDSERVQGLLVISPNNTGGSRNISPHDFLDWRARQEAFERLEAYTQTTVTMTGGGGYPHRVQAARVTPGTFRALRAPTLLGRDLRDEDAEPGAPAVILIGHTLWHSQFGSAPDVVGRVVTIDGVPTTIVGVMPPKFGFPQSRHAWLPLTVTPPAKRGSGTFVSVVGRLKPDVKPAQASADMLRISEQLEREHPENKGLRAQVGPFVRQSIGNDVVSTLMTMLVAVFGVMLIACVNVTNLQLARAADRTREVAIRVAIGAGRWRIVRQMLVEGLMISGGGAALGLALAWVGTRLFSDAIVDTDPPFWIDVRLDWVVLAFVTFITVTAALVSSLVPGWRLARTDVNGAIKDEGRGTTSLRMGRFTRWLVVVEVAVSCILLVVSGLMVRSIIQNSRFSVPFSTDDVLVGGVILESRVVPQAEVPRVRTEIEERLNRIPGARAVGLGSGFPRGGGGAQWEVEGRPVDSPDAHPRSEVIFGNPGYFQALRITPVLGRGFTAGDVDTALAVAIVDESFARKHLPDGPIGRRIRSGQRVDNGLVFDKSPWVTIVGVVPTLVDAGFSSRETGIVFRPQAQNPVRSFSVFAAARSGDPFVLANPVRQVLAEVGQGVPLSAPNSLADVIWQEGWPARVFGGLFTAFGLAALLLASAGLYGVMAFGVRQRTQEIGVRLAMGATRGRVLRMVLWQGMWRVGAAVAIGLVPGWALGGQMRELLRGVDPADPVVMASAAGTLLLSGLLASLVPALRASSVNPIVALRGE